MNQLAKELGMTNTRYANSTGLPAENHYTSATDISLLASALIREFPDYYKWYSQRQFTYNGITQANRNSLLWRDESVDGMKTGYTENAGYCLVSSAERDGMRLIAVVLGTASPAARANESAALLNYGFRFYETMLLWEQGEIVASKRVWKGVADEVDLVTPDAIYVTIPRGSAAQLETVIDAPERLVAPIYANTALASASISVGGKVVRSTKLYNGEAVEETGILGSAWDEVLLWFE